MTISRVTAAWLILCCAVGDSVILPECPEDSVPRQNGVGCECQAICEPPVCRAGQRAVQVRVAIPGKPGSCCPRYECIPSGTDVCPDDSAPTDDGGCKCLPTCPPHKCLDGQRPVIVRPAAVPEMPGDCCPLYKCVPSESVSWIDTDAEDEKNKRTDPKECIYNGVSRTAGERWQETACISCYCDPESWEAHCQGPMCKPCEVATPIKRGECCPRCEHPPVITDPITHCETLRNCSLPCERYIVDDKGCPVCRCVESEVDAEGDSDPSSQSGAGEDEGSSRICPELKCDLHCEHGLVMDENDCTLCECRTAQQRQPVSCPSIENCKKKCPFGYRSNKRGCPTCRCRASCMDHLNQTHPEGAVWHPDYCTKCSCESGGRLTCKEIVCSVGCKDPLPPEPGTCCPVCPILNLPKDRNTTTIQRVVGRGWGTVPITLIVILTLLCLLLIIHIVRVRFRGRLSPSEISYEYSSYPPQYYKCVPAYDPAVQPSSTPQPMATALHRPEKIIPL